MVAHRFRGCDLRCIALIGLSLALSAQTIGAERGRLQVKGNQLLTDKGTVLRGGSCYHPQSTADMRKWATEYGLNCFRILVMSNADATDGWAVGDRTGTQALSLLDALVNAADQAGLYIIIDNHGGDPGSGDGKYSMTQVVNFWKFIAPRYKDRTHVSYEIKNEPYSWGCAGNESGREVMRKGFQTIRSAAPNTHILVWSYANLSSCIPSEVESTAGIDYGNASVAFHWYNGGSESTIRAVQALGISLLCTEMKDHDNSNHDLATANKDMISRVTVLEKCQVGWTLFRFPTNSDITRRLYTIKDAFDSAGLRWVPDYGSWPVPAGSDATGTALYQFTLPSAVSVTTPGHGSLVNLMGARSTHGAATPVFGTIPRRGIRKGTIIIR